MVNKKGFTLIELVIVISLLGILLTLVGISISFFQKQSTIGTAKQSTMQELSILNSSLNNIIKNSYGIVYAGTDTVNSIGKITVYDDKLEHNTTEIYVEQDPDRDISRVMIRRNWGDPFAIVSNLLVVQKFKVTTSPDPRTTPRALEDQPWVGVDLQVRARSPLQNPDQDDHNEWYTHTGIASKIRMVLRNYTPSSLKN